MKTYKWNKEVSKVSKMATIDEKYLKNYNYSKAVITESEIATINAFWNDSGGSFFSHCELGELLRRGSKIT